MKIVYECDVAKKKDLIKLLENEPYAEDSFVRIGYKTKEGMHIGEDKNKFYVCISADEEFIKKANEKLKGIAERAKDDVEKRIVSLIEKEEENATIGFGDIFS